MPRAAKPKPQPAPMIDDDKLTDKQRAFVDAYIVNGFNGTRAAITAGYAEISAHAEASRQLRNVKVRELIDAFFAEHAMTSREVIARLTEHARGDIGDIWNPESGQVDWDKAIETGKTALIKKIKHTTKRTTTPDGTDIEIFEDEVELHSVQTALQLLGKQHGLFVDKSEVNHTGAIILKTGMSLDDL